VVVAAGDRSRLLGEARELAAGLASLLRRRVPVAVGIAQPGDVAQSLSRPDGRLGGEGYALRISDVFRISAPSRTGVFYGGETLLQLVHQRRAIPRGAARDWPRYPERGLMLDVSRNVYPARWIESEIKQLAYLKLNVLHLHLTDDQRWGIASRIDPGVVGPHALTFADIRAIVRLASRYHITVVPEIDMPGHMDALLRTRPALRLKPVRSTGATGYTGRLDITNPAALTLVRKLIDQYLPLFPGRYWDMGDDEYISPSLYALYPQLERYAIRTYGPRATVGDVIHGFINWVDRLVRAQGKTLRVWNDQLGYTGVVPVKANVDVDWWINTSPFGDPRTVPPATLLAEGHQVLNAGWFPTYYTTNLGPIAGMSDMQQAYQDWSVNQFEGPETTSHVMQEPQTVPASAPGLLGSTLNVWGPLPDTPRQVATGIASPLAVIAQKTWDSPPLTPSYERFQAVIAGVGSAPGQPLR
jgi:hexosaminidase